MKKILSLLILVLTFSVSVFTQIKNPQCPLISVTGPSSVTQIDEPIFFSASVSSEEKNYSVKYKWTVDKGKIISGEGTTTVQISTQELRHTTLTATFEIEGLPKECVNKDFDTAVIAKEISGDPYDEYGELLIYDELYQFDNFLAGIDLNDKDYYGFVLINTDEKNSSALKKRLKILADHLDKRKFSRQRITFAINTDKDVEGSTSLWIVPPDAKLPKCEDCEIIKASDIK